MRAIDLGRDVSSGEHGSLLAVLLKRAKAVRFLSNVDK
jgi:hypothetical protein